MFDATIEIRATDKKNLIASLHHLLMKLDSDTYLVNADSFNGVVKAHHYEACYTIKLLKESLS
jgi:hypothetical protein